MQNLADGARHRGGYKRERFDIAHGEANEMKGSLVIPMGSGIDGIDCGDAAGGSIPGGVCSATSAYGDILATTA